MCFSCAASTLCMLALFVFGNENIEKEVNKTGIGKSIPVLFVWLFRIQLDFGGEELETFIAKKVLIGAAHSLTLAQLMDLAKVYLPQSVIRETLEELQRL